MAFFHHVRITCRVVVFSLFFFIVSCNSGTPQEKIEKGAEVSDSSLSLKEKKVEAPAQERPGFELWRMNDTLRKTLRTIIHSDSIVLLSALNRIDPERVFRLDSLIAPKRFDKEWLWYSPWPQFVNDLNQIRLIILLDAFSQSFAAFENGHLTYWGPVSMGKRTTQTPKGLFHTNWKAKTTISTDNPEWILNWYFNLVNNTGVSMHEYELPGYPASHSCIRLRAKDAEWIYYKAQQWRLNESGRNILAFGTPVIIFGHYPFGKPRPWYLLSKDSTALDVKDDSLKVLMDAYKPMIMERQNLRDSLYPEKPKIQ